MFRTLTTGSTPATSYPAPKLVLAVLVALVGDRLLYDRDLGVSVPLFLGLLGIAVAVANPLRATMRERGIATAILIAGLLPLIESVGPLSVTFGILGLALFAAGIAGTLNQGLRAISATMADLLLVGPFRLVPDLLGSARLPGTRVVPRAATVVGWILPVLLSGVFAILFASANPLIDGWFTTTDWSFLKPSVTPLHLFAWLALLSIAWAFVTIRPKSRQTPPDGDPLPPTPFGGAPAIMPRVLDAGTVLRCLVLFNLLFAVQSALDLAYLWGGVALPAGVTYAAYAHRGAYPLIATALLAAGFVLVALRPGGPGEGSKPIRRLVYLWIAQNVLLVVSSLLRLDLYVATYSLTIPRAAAFVWMGLVGVGLVLILMRIALRRTNVWLVAANGIALAATLYLCAFVNMSGFVADYNLAHSRSEGRPFDAVYAMSLGPAAIPAVDRFLEEQAGLFSGHLIRWRNALAADHLTRMDDWCAWTLRGGRLLGYLQAHPLAPRTSAGTP